MCCPTQLQRLPGFMSGLCTMVVSGPTYAVKLGAAIALSNTVVRNWTRTADKVAHARDAVLAASDKEVVRNNIIEVRPPLPRPLTCNSTGAGRRSRLPPAPPVAPALGQGSKRCTGAVCVAQLAMGVDAKPILKTVAEAITHICHSDFPVCYPTACARMCHASRHRSGLERVCVRCGLAGQLAGVPGCAGGEPEARGRAAAGAQRAWLNRCVPP